MDGADWLRTQLTSFGCAACGAPYEPGRIRLLAERDGLFFVDLACTACASRAVAIVTVDTDDDDEPRADPGDLVQLAAGEIPPAVARLRRLPVHANIVMATIWPKQSSGMS